MVPYTKQWHVKLHRLPPGEVLTKLDLDRPGLEVVKAAVADGDQPRALAELLRYYRATFPLPARTGSTTATFEAADRICRHIFQWGPYPPADYGSNIDWTINPAGDIEWVAGIYRFHWANELTKAYTATRDDKYARAFVELTTDWIAKHPLDDWTRTHPTITRWKGFAWLDLQTGIRATQMVAAFKAMVHSEAITPEFLAIFMASLHDHQHKTALIPMGMVHNKAIFEQRGVLNVCQAFPEFRKTSHWAQLAVERTEENLLKQTTPEGIQREWCGSYHAAVLRDALDVMEKSSQLGIAVSEEFRRRLRRMCNYVFALATPDLCFPMFGDTGRVTPKDGKTLMYNSLLHFSEVWNDPKYAARAELDLAALPERTSYAFESAGIYVMRSEWGTSGTYLVLQCAPPPLSRHDQPDNGTFELFAHGRWLMTDSGYYTYGHDKAARAWHRQTRVHQTLTLDGKDSKTDGRLRLWQSSPGLDALVVENPSYPGLLHRRSVWFVDRQFFVFLDEAIGKAPGELCLHWTPAPGTGRFNSEERTAFTTEFPDANVLIQTSAPQHTQFEQEDGWFAWDYGQRVARKTLKVKHLDAAPARFLTLIAPYRGTNAPVVEAKFIGNPAVGSDDFQISVRAFGKDLTIGRNLENKTASCESAN